MEMSVMVKHGSERQKMVMSSVMAKHGSERLKLRVLKRCKNMYISHSRSSNANKWFVVITTGFTLGGIIYGFWYKNFGPGAMHHDKH